MIIRSITENDSKQLAQVIKKVESESPYMLFEAGERQLTEEQASKMINRIESEENSCIFVAAKEQLEIVGYLFAIGGNVRKNQHCVYIAIGILKEYTGKGIGTKLFEELFQWAKQNEIKRIELTVVVENESAVSLYKKMGFEIEGVKRNSLKILGEYVDEFYMSKIL